MKRFFEPTKGSGRPLPQSGSQPAPSPVPTGGKGGRGGVFRPYFGNPNPADRWFAEAQRQEILNSQKAQEKDKKIRLTQPPKF